MHQVKMIKILPSGSDKGSDGTTTGQSESNSSNKDKVENPQTNAGTPAYIYAIPVASLALLITNHIVC